MSKVSVLVAVYNAEKYLRECLDSLSRQSLHDIQIICVDDASEDHSCDILNEYARSDNRFLVKKMDHNSGQAVARNEGLKYADGDYVCFLDSDDYLSDDALQQMVSVFEKHPETDCVLLHLILIHENGNFEEFPVDDFSVLPGETAFRKSLSWNGIHGVYGVRAAIQKQYPYDDSALLFSDDNTTRIHYLVSKEVRNCEGIYYYRQHAVSMTHSVSRRRFEKMKAAQSLLAQLKAMEVTTDIIHVLKENVWLTVIDQYKDYFRFRHLLSEADRRYALTQIRQGWQNADLSGVPNSLLLKPGYMPLRFSWNLFRLQEEIYFSLRKIFGRI